MKADLTAITFTLPEFRRLVPAVAVDGVGNDGLRSLYLNFVG